MDKGELRKEIKLKRENIDRDTKLRADEKIRKQNCLVHSAA